MASFRERAEAELRGTTVENVQAQKSAKNNTSFRERAAAELTRSSKQANTAYRTQQRRQKLHEEEQQRKRTAQRKSGVSPFTQMQKQLANSPVSQGVTQNLVTEMTQPFTRQQEATNAQKKRYASDEFQQNYAKMNDLGRSMTRDRVDTGTNESHIGEGWQSRVDLDKMWGETVNNTAKQKATDRALAQLDNSTPSTTNMNDATRYEQMQEARRRANNQKGSDAGAQEAFETAKWEETQRLGIQGAKNPQLLNNLVQLNKLYATANLGHESVAGAAQEQYDTLYDQLKQQYGDQVDDWTEYVKRMQESMSMDEMVQRIAAASDEHPIVSSLATPLVNVASGAGIVDVAAQRLGNAISGKNTPIDYNRAAQLPSKWTNTTRGVVSQKIAEDTDGWIGSNTPVGNLYSGLYNIGMSMADSIVGQKLGGATVFMGGSAATNAMNEARERGASTDQALTMGLLSGVAETIMEKVPMDRLLSQTNPTNLKTAIQNILSQGASEATEEGLTTLANTVSDAIVMGDKSELNTAVRAYRANGYSEEDAEKKAFTDWLIGLAGDTIGGFVSGGLFAAAYNVPGGIDYKRSGGDVDTDIATDNQTMDPLDYAFQETMKPTKEQQAFDQAMEDTANWMLGKEKTATAEAETESTKVNTDPAKHTPAEQAVIEEYQAAVDPAAIFFVDKWNSAQNENYKKKMKFVVGDVSSRTVSDIEQMYGLDTSGYSHVLSGNALEHIEKRHGASGEADHSMADTNDLARMRYVLDNYDTVSPVLDKNGAQKYSREIRNSDNSYAPLIQFQKKVNGTYYVVEAVPDSAAKQYSVVSAYMTKAAGSTTPTASIRNTDQVLNMPNNDPQLTSEVRHDANVPNSTIPNSHQNVNQNQDVNSDNDMGHGAVGAAEIGFNPYSNYQNQTDAADFMPEGANAARPVDMPKVDPTGKQVRSGAKTIYGAEATTDARATQMENEYMEGLYGYDPVRDKPTLEKAKANLQQEGYDRAYARVAEKLSQVKDMKQTALEAFLLYSDAVQSGRDGDAANLCLLLSESGTEFGQGAQVFSMFRSLSPEGQLFALQQSVERLNNKIKLEHGKRAVEIEVDPTLVQQYIDAPNQQVRDTVMEQIYQNIGEQIPTTFMEAANQWRYMSMLLNPSTHLKNMAGNISMMVLKGSKDVVGTGIEVVSNAISGGKTGRTKSVLNPLRAKDRNLMDMAWADFDNVRDDVAGIGKNTDNLMGKAGEYRNLWKLNDPKTKAGEVVDKALRTAEKVPQANTKLMDIEDRWFSQPDYAMSLAGYMKANHQTEITAEARAYAIKEAQKATFRDANGVSTFARNMGHSNSKLWNGIVNAVFPFKGTPANVGVRAVEYSPLGFVTTVEQAVRAKKNGTFKATDFIDNISANLVGSALSVFGYWLASNGLLRVAGTGDDKEKAEQKENGYRDNSFKLFGYSIPENCFTSVSAPLFIGAAAYEAIASKALTGEAYTLDDYIQALSTTIDPLLEQTMLTGLNDVLTTAKYNQGGLGDTLSEMALQVAGTYLSSYIPTLLSRVSAAADGVQRQVYIDKNKPFQGVQRQVQNLMMKTPARQYLNERVDRYGNVQTQENLFNTGHEKLDKALNFGFNVVTPSYPSKIEDNAISDELSRLYRSSDVDNSERKLFQSDAPKSIQVNGVTKNLTGEQYENYEKIRGSNTTEYLGALQGDSLYDSMDDSMQAYATDKMHDYIEQTSKAELGIGYKPTDDWIADLQGKSEAEIVETVLYKTFESAINSKEYSSKYEGMADLVDQDKLDEAMAITMMPEKMQTAYQNVAKAGGVSVDEWLDLYAYAYPYGKTESGTINNEQIRDEALKYIKQQSWGDDKKTAAADAIFQFLTDTIPLERDIPYNWSLDLGDSGLAYVESKMSKTQKKNYEKYVKGYFDNEQMKLYLDAYAFKGTAKSDKDENGKTIKQAMDYVKEFINEMDVDNKVKIRIFLGLGYAEQNVPDEWLY